MVWEWVAEGEEGWSMQGVCRPSGGRRWKGVKGLTWMLTRVNINGGVILLRWIGPGDGGLGFLWIRFWVWICFVWFSFVF